MKNQPLSERQQDTIFAIEQAKDYEDLKIKVLEQTYTIRPAKYAKGKLAIHCKPDNSGFKTVAALIISQMPGVRYSNREGAYICSPSRAAKFEAKLSQVQKRKEATALINDAHKPGKALDHLDGDPTNNDPSNLRVVTLRANL